MKYQGNFVGEFGEKTWEPHGQNHMRNVGKIWENNLLSTKISRIYLNHSVNNSNNNNN